MSGANLSLKSSLIEEDSALPDSGIGAGSLFFRRPKRIRPCAAQRKLWGDIQAVLWLPTGDSLSYALGFLIYAWLIRILTYSQYADLSIATSIYQVLMMVAAIGVDLIGPGLLSDHPSHIWTLVGKFETIRISVALAVCLPIIAILAAWYWRQGRSEVAILVLASFAMVLSRVINISYVAIACGMPVSLAKSRVLGMGTFLVLLLGFANVSKAHLWMIPVLNAAGVAVGRVFLKRRLRTALPKRKSPVAIPLRTRHILGVGARSGLGQLIMLGFQTLDIIYLGFYVKPGDLGQYAMIARLYILGTAALTAVFNAFVRSSLTIATFTGGLGDRSGSARLLAWPDLQDSRSWAREWPNSLRIDRYPQPTKCNSVRRGLSGSGNCDSHLFSAGSFEVRTGIRDIDAPWRGGDILVDVGLVPRIGLTGGALGQISASVVVLVASAAFVRSKAVRTRLTLAGVSSADRHRNCVCFTCALLLFSKAELAFWRADRCKPLRGVICLQWWWTWGSALLCRCTACGSARVSR